MERKSGERKIGRDKIEFPERKAREEGERRGRERIEKGKR